MPKFDIEVIRTSHQFKTITVEAETLEQAQTLALNQAGDHEFPGERSAEYSIDGQIYNERQRQLTWLGATPFTSADDPEAEYEKLLSASEAGLGDDAAGQHASVPLHLENSTVDMVIGLIEDHIGQIKSVFRL